MKIAFLIDCADEKQNEIKKTLAPLGYDFIVSNNPEEICQTGNQLKEVVLCFSEAKIAYNYLMKYNFGTFNSLRLLFMPQKPNLSPETAKKLRYVRLDVVTFADAPLIKKLLKELGETKEVDSTELEFLASAKGDKDAA